MEKNIEMRIEEKSKSLKRRLLGLCGRESFKSEEQVAKALYLTGITESLSEAKEAVQSFPDTLRISYPLSMPFLQGASNDYLRIIRLKNPLIRSDHTYKIYSLHTPRVGID